MNSSMILITVNLVACSILWVLIWLLNKLTRQEKVLFTQLINENLKLVGENQELRHKLAIFPLSRYPRVGEALSRPLDEYGWVRDYLCDLEKALREEKTK